MKKTRRIEVTAFTRKTTVFVGEAEVKLSDQPPRQIDVTRSSDERSARFLETDLVEAIFSSADVEASPKLTGLIEALVISNGKSAGAAGQLGLSHSRFYSKLRSLDLSIRNLKTNLKLLREAGKGNGSRK